MNDPTFPGDDSRAVLATASDLEAMYAAHALFVLRAKLQQQRLAREQSGTSDYLRGCERKMSEIATTLASRDGSS